MKIFFDGGCRGDPAIMEVAVVAAGRTTILADLGRGTSTEAEWLALTHALRIAQSLGLCDFVLVGDSADVVAKANGVVKCRGDSARHLDRFRALVSPAGRPRVRLVKRSQNLAGIALAARHPR